MPISNKLKEQEWYPRLRKRGPNFAMMVDHVESRGAGMIVETGTARIKGNWEGDGQSTLIWDWLAEELGSIEVVSIDITPENIAAAESQTKNVHYMLGDSVKTLAEFNDSAISRMSLLYLDSFDWDESLNLESPFHHLCELAVLWAKLPSGCMVAVDDRHGEQKGKHWLVEGFMKSLDIKPVFKNHQMGWVKPLG